MTWTSSAAPYVTPPKQGEADAWTRAGGSQRLLEVGVIKAPDDVREALQLADDADVVRRMRLILKDGEPIELAVSHWPAEWAASTGLAESKPVKGGTIRLLADLGWLTEDWQDDVSPVIADEQSLPHAPAGAAVLVTHRTLWNADGVPFQHDVMHSWDGHAQRYTGKAG